MIVSDNDNTSCFIVPNTYIVHNTSCFIVLNNDSTSCFNKTK